MGVLCPHAERPRPHAGNRARPQGQRTADHRLGADPPVSGSDASGIADLRDAGYHLAGGAATQTAKHQFYGSIELDPIQAKKQFADLMDEVVLQFTSRLGVKGNIAIEIQAESETD